MSDVQRTLDYMSTETFLDGLKRLTLASYDAAKVVVEGKVKELIKGGPAEKDKPTYKMLAREQPSLFTPLDLIMIVVFIAAFALSTVHIVFYMGEISKVSCHADVSSAAIDNVVDVIDVVSVAGIYIDVHTCTVVHQVGYLFLSESSMILFMVFWRVSMRNTTGNMEIPILGFTLKINRKLLSIYLLLSIAAMIFVFTANLASGLSWFNGSLPPIFTIGISFQIEHLIIKYMDRLEKVYALLEVRLDEFQLKLDRHQAALDDYTKHPEYEPMLRREIWERLAKLKDNESYIDAPTRLKLAAVKRELLRDGWAYNSVSDDRVMSDRATQLGVPVDVLLSNSGGGGLIELSTMVDKAADGLTGDRALISTAAGTANLELLVWTDTRQNQRPYGPYGSKSKMATAIRTVSNMRYPAS